MGIITSGAKESWEKSRQARTEFFRRRHLESCLGAWLGHDPDVIVWDVHHKKKISIVDVTVWGRPCPKIAFGINPNGVSVRTSWIDRGSWVPRPRIEHSDRTLLEMNQKLGEMRGDRV